MTLEEIERIISLLERVAVAFEQQNCINTAYITQQEEWHAEDIGPLLVAIHEQDAQKNEDFRQEQSEMLAAQIVKQHEVLREVGGAFFDRLLAEHQAIRDTINTLCEKAEVKKPDWNA